MERERERERKRDETHEDADNVEAARRIHAGIDEGVVGRVASVPVVVGQAAVAAGAV
jgi:hypothetical protein